MHHFDVDDDDGDNNVNFRIILWSDHAIIRSKITKDSLVEKKTKETKIEKPWDTIRGGNIFKKM